MEELRKIIKENRKVKDSTLKIYTTNVNKLAMNITGKPFSNINFLKNKYNKIIELLDTYKISTKKNYISSIIVVLSPKGKGEYEKGFSNIGKKYLAMLILEQDKYNKDMDNQGKSKKQKVNWSSMESLKSIMEGYRKKIKKLGYTQTCKKNPNIKDRELLQKYLVSGLYLLIPPRRNIYASVKIITHNEYRKVSDEIKDKTNYLVIYSRNKKTFVFSNYKTRKQHGIQRISIPKDLNSIINLWLCFNKTEFLLTERTGEKKMTENGLTRFLQKTFKETGKKISSTMIRHIFLTEKYGDETSIKEKQKTANDMGHSVDTQQGTYVKKKENIVIKFD